MIVAENKIRVRYAETDQMGYVYYGNYSTYFEVARVELFRSFGISYKEMEEQGVMMPVLEQQIKYIRPAKYDDLLTIKTYLRNKPGVRIKFEYEVFNEENTLLTKAETMLVFVDMKTGKPTNVPQYFDQLIDENFKEEV